MMHIPKFIAAILLATLASASAAAQDGYLEFSCGSLASLENAYGPFDYSNSTHVRENLPIVERFHFNADVEYLKGGMSGTLNGDLDYTLRAFPNHLRALDAMGRLRLREAGSPTGYPAECYFERALKFRPNDAGSLMVYGIFRYRQKKLSEAIDLLSRASRLQPSFAEIHYNLGLVLVAAGEMEQAVEEAVIARDLGYPLQGLVTKLEQNGHWPPAPEE